MEKKKEIKKKPLLPPMIRQTLDEWKAEAVSRFGDDFQDWKFKCPACGHVSSGRDFRIVGSPDPNDMYCTCIGRHNGNGANGMTGKDLGFGCNWASFGLFGTLGKGRYVTDGDKTSEVFDFAEKGSEGTYKDGKK